MHLGIVAVLLAALASAQPGSGESDVGGRTFEQWMKDITHKDPSKRENALRAVLAFGPERAAEAVPAMLTELRRHTPGFAIDTSVRVNIVIALGKIFPNVKNPDLKQRAEAITLLTRLLRDSQDVVQFRAAEALGAIGPEARVAIPDLLVNLRDLKAWEVRQAAATALGQISFDPKNGPPPAVLNALYDRIKEDPAFQVRLAAIQALALAGPTADLSHRVGMIKVIEPIARKDTEPAIQVWAQLALMSLTGKVQDDGLDQIARLLHKGDLLTRNQAAQAIGMVGVRAKETVPALVTGLSDPDPNVQGWVIWALGRMEGHAAVAIPALEKIAADAKAPEPIKKAAKMSVEQIKKGKTTAPK